MPTQAPSRAPERLSPRKRKSSPSDRRRKARRALRSALRTSAEIQGKARLRQGERLAGAANAATSLDTDLRELYEAFGDDRRNLFATGLVSDGTPFTGRTWRAQ